MTGVSLLEVELRFIELRFIDLRLQSAMHGFAAMRIGYSGTDLRRASGGVTGCS